MGKKRQRVLIDQDNIELDPNFFDRGTLNASSDQPNGPAPVNKDAPSPLASIESPQGSTHGETKGDADPSNTELPEQSPDQAPGSLPSTQPRLQIEEKTAHIVEQGPHKKARHESGSDSEEREIGQPPMDSVLEKTTEQKIPALPTAQRSEPGRTVDPEVIVIQSSDGIVDLCDDNDDECTVTQLVERQPSTESASRSRTPVSASERSAASTSPQEADESRRVRKEDSLRTVSVHVESLVPGSERNFDTQWSWSQSLGDLRDQFGSDTVLVCEGSKKPWFYSPKRIAKDGSEHDGRLAIQIFGAKQWEDLIRKAELGEFALPSDPPNEGMVPPAAQEDSSGFIIVIRSKKDEVKAMVTPNTTVLRLIEHFRGVTNTPSAQNIRFVFDGDSLDPNSTMADLDIEEDDGLDAYIE